MQKSSKTFPTVNVMSDALFMTHTVPSERTSPSAAKLPCLYL